MRTVLLWLFTVLLTACTATGPLYAPSAQPSSDQVLVYLYRKTFYATALPMKVEVNSKEIGILPNNSYTSIYVPAGEVNLSATRWEDFTYPESKRVSISGTVVGGETYFLKISQVLKGTIITTKLERVSAEIAESELKDLKRAEKEK